MYELTQRSLNTDQLNMLNDSLAKKVPDDVRYMLNTLPPEDIAHLLESSPPKQRSLLWKLVNSDLEGDVLSELSEDVRRFFLQDLNIHELADVLSGQDSDDLADMLQQLPDQIATQVLSHMEQRDRHRVKQVLGFRKDTAGGIMNTDTLSVSKDLSIDMVLRYFRQGNKLPEPLDHLYVLEKNGELTGILPFSKLLSAGSATTVSAVMDTEFTFIPVDTCQHEIANIFERKDLVSAPVIDDKGALLGRITIDDVVDVIRDEADHAVMSMAGLNDKSDTFAGVWSTTKNRAVWLCINLMAAFVSASIIGLFQETIEKVVALAVLMPVVASMGGNAGCQSMTLVIRAFSQGQITQTNIRWLLLRELGSGLYNGMLWGIIVSAIAWLWFGSTAIAGIVAIAILLNISCAVIIGAILPGALRRFGIDPTLAGSVILTTTTDAIGFCSFLGLSALFFM